MASVVALQNPVVSPPAPVVRADNRPASPDPVPVSDEAKDQLSLSTSSGTKSDARAKDLLDTASQANYRGLRGAADQAYRQAIDAAVTVEMANRIAQTAHHDGYRAPAALALRGAVALAKTVDEALMVADSANYRGFRGATDLALRRAADLAGYSEEARRVGRSAQHKGFSGAADYAFRKAGNLPPEPPPAPRESWWRRLLRFFHQL